MDRETANGFLRYIYIFDRIKNDFDDLYNNSKSDDLWKNDETLYSILCSIPRIIPLKFNKKSQTTELDHTDGILLLKNGLEYLEKFYVEIFDNNKAFLEKVRDIRNKYEHAPHKFSLNNYVGDNSNSSFGFAVEKDNQEVLITISSEELREFFNQIDALFHRIIFDIMSFAEKEKLTDYPCYEYLKKHS